MGGPNGPIINVKTGRRINFLAPYNRSNSKETQQTMLGEINKKKQQSQN